MNLRGGLPPFSAHNKSQGCNSKSPPHGGVVDVLRQSKTTPTVVEVTQFQKRPLVSASDPHFISPVSGIHPDSTGGVFN